jgi:hypothetical protein
MATSKFITDLPRNSKTGVNFCVFCNHRKPPATHLGIALGIGYPMRHITNGLSDEISQIDHGCAPSILPVQSWQTGAIHASGRCDVQKSTIPQHTRWQILSKENGN